MKEESIALYFTQGSSDKVYQVQLVETDGGWLVNFQNGRRGKPLRPGTKTNTPLPFDKAKAAYDKLVKTKMSGGYTPQESGEVYADTDKAGDLTTYQPQLLNPIGVDDIAKILESWGEIALQTKHDGERRGLLNENGAVGANRKGLRVGLTDTIKSAVETLMTDLDAAFDGEDMGSHVVIFDVLSWKGKSVTNEPFETRAAYLKTLNDAVAKASLSDVVKVDMSTLATTYDQVLAFIEKARLDNEEGVVLRNPKAPYNAGRPASGGNALKLKFVESATVRVKTPHATKRSVSLELHNGTAWVDVGNVTIPGVQPIPNAGDLVEVGYLYAYEGGSLFQPTYQGVRTDLDETAATLSQLKYKR